MMRLRHAAHTTTGLIPPKCTKEVSVLLVGDMFGGWNNIGAKGMLTMMIIITCGHGLNYVRDKIA